MTDYFDGFNRIIQCFACNRKFEDLSFKCGGTVPCEHCGAPNPAGACE